MRVGVYDESVICEKATVVGGGGGNVGYGEGIYYVGGGTVDVVGP